MIRQYLDKDYLFKDYLRKDATFRLLDKHFPELYEDSSLHDAFKTSVFATMLGSQNYLNFYTLFLILERSLVSTFFFDSTLSLNSIFDQAILLREQLQKAWPKLPRKLKTAIRTVIKSCITYSLTNRSTTKVSEKLSELDYHLKRLTFHHDSTRLKQQLDYILYEFLTITQ